MNRAERRRQERLQKRHKKQGVLPKEVSVENREGYFVGRFTAMASPCEILVESQNEKTVCRIVSQAYAEAIRIEKKYSRYNKEGVVYQIHQNKGQKIEVDAETAQLLDFARQCYEMSEGLFDITSGVLRKAWVFDGSDNIPTESQVLEVLENVGWEKVQWTKPYIVLPENMEIDFGGIGKEYAVDRIGMLLKDQFSESLVVNLGGDIFCPRPLSGDRSWKIGVESTESDGEASRQLELKVGALATSGDSRRFLFKDGKRYSHILNPKTGWPIEDAPRSVTVAADTCTEAGILSTLASLQGPDAESFLKSQDVSYWIK